MYIQVYESYPCHIQDSNENGNKSVKRDLHTHTHTIPRISNKNHKYVKITHTLDGAFRRQSSNRFHLIGVSFKRW